MEQKKTLFNYLYEDIVKQIKSGKLAYGERDVYKRQSLTEIGASPIFGRDTWKNCPCAGFLSFASTRNVYSASVSFTISNILCGYGVIWFTAIQNSPFTSSTASFNLSSTCEKAMYWGQMSSHRPQPTHICHSVPNRFLKSYISVSYTHLDVYKRQGKNIWKQNIVWRLIGMIRVGRYW